MAQAPKPLEPQTQEHIGAIYIWLQSYNIIDQQEILNIHYFPSVKILKHHHSSVQGPCFLFQLWNVQNLIYLRAPVEGSAVSGTCSTLNLLNLWNILFRLFTHLRVSLWALKSPHLNSSSGLTFMHLNVSSQTHQDGSCFYPDVLSSLEYLTNSSVSLQAGTISAVASFTVQEKKPWGHNWCFFCCLQYPQNPSHPDSLYFWSEQELAATLLWILCRGHAGCIQSF